MNAESEEFNTSGMHSGLTYSNPMQVPAALTYVVAFRSHSWQMPDSTLRQPRNATFHTIPCSYIVYNLFRLFVSYVIYMSFLSNVQKTATPLSSFVSYSPKFLRVTVRFLVFTFIRFIYCDFSSYALINHHFNRLSPFPPITSFIFSISPAGSNSLKRIY